MTDDEPDLHEVTALDEVDPPAFFTHGMFPCIFNACRGLILPPQGVKSH